MSDALQADSPLLSPEEMQDVNDFYDNPREHNVGVLEELLEELHDAECGN